MQSELDVTSFLLDRELGIWVHPEHRDFGYSEGAEVERRTLKLLRETKDLSLASEELEQKICDWPTQYHFSPARHNLLRHLDIRRDMSVLELGAGCGAITRQLGEAAAEVWAVEGGPIRAACAAARTRDLGNVRVFSADFQSIKTDRRFDVVTLIGVLEYSPVFFHAENPFLECLKLARSLLKPDGTLFLAIENQLGLKYFCGAPEDHTGKPYDGVEDQYRRRGVRTCGKAELVSVLSAAGFSGIEFHYPFPDYKLPSWVFTHRAFETPAFDACAILRMVDSVHEGQKTAYSADERKIRSVLHRNGLLADMANSFLVIASSSAQRSALSPDGLLAAGYVTERQPWFNTQTRMGLDQKGNILVQKTLLWPQLPPTRCDLLNVPYVEPYRTGPQLEQLIVRSLQTHGLDEALAGLRRWIDFIIQHGIRDRDEADVHASILKPEFFDCTPPNLIVEGQTLEPVDLEWRYLGRLPLRIQVLRYLKLFAAREKKLLTRHLQGKNPPAVQLAERLDIKVSKAQYQEALEWMHQVNDWIVPPFSAARPNRRQAKHRKASFENILRKLKPLHRLLKSPALAASQS